MASYKDFLPAVQSGGGWQRPSDWLALPTVTSAEQKFVGLHAVFPDGDNVCALLLTTSAGQYEVDWGDGTVTLHNSNVKAEHQYDYSTISASTDCSRGYRQVLVTVTPVSGNILTINFQQRYTARNQVYSTGWLDVIGSFPNANTGQSITFGGATVRHQFVEQVTWVTIGNATDCTSMFAELSSLQSVPLFDTSSVTDFNSFFIRCIKLSNVPVFDLSSAINLTAFFHTCTALVEPPFMDTSNATTFSQMFLNAGVTILPLYDLSNATAVGSMFQSCVGLVQIPLFDTSNVTNFVSFMRNCPALQYLPALSTAFITPSAGSDFNLFAQNGNNLRRCQMVFARTVDFSQCSLSRTAIVEIFTNLVDRSATTSATITITGNWGVADLTAGDLLIATSKNWVVAT
jgi:hypothetical protein